MATRTIVLDPFLSATGAESMVELCERFGSYGLYVTETSGTEFAPELAQRFDAARHYVRTGGRSGRQESARTLALRTNYLRESYAYGDEVFVEGIEAFQWDEQLLDAARQLFGRPVVEPSIVYANILLPGQELAVHTDVPEFRGANRKVVPQWLLVVMHHAGLFEVWRMPIATGIAYFAPDEHQPEGGALAYYPTGPAGRVEMLAAIPNTAIVLDTDSVFHGVDRVGAPGLSPVEVAPGNVLVFDGHGRWSLRPAPGDPVHLAELTWDDFRFSVSWKAYCFADEVERDVWRAHEDDLLMDRILDVLVDDLRERDLLGAEERPPDQDLALLLIDTSIDFSAPAPAA